MLGSFRGIRLRYFALALALIVLTISVISMVRTWSFVKTEGTIVSIEESESSTQEDTDYDVTVRYTAGGKEYTGLLDSYSPSYEVGKTVTVRYDPKDPTRISGSQSFFFYFIGVSLAVLVGVLISILRDRKAQKQLEASRDQTNGVSYAPSAPGPERELYFLTDLGTPKYGHRIEDRDRRVLYEAKMTKFTLTTPFGFDFIDHVLGRTTPHLVGHEESSEWDSILLDNHHTFTFDGEFIWKHLKRNGITVDSSLDPRNPLKVKYRIFRDNVRIAEVESSSKYVHEEDAEAHGSVVNAIPAPGFYRIFTTETNLDLLFVTLLAFARTEATDDQGGNIKTILGSVRGK